MCPAHQGELCASGYTNSDELISELCPQAEPLLQRYDYCRAESPEFWRASLPLLDAGLYEELFERLGQFCLRSSDRLYMGEFVLHRVVGKS